MRVIRQRPRLLRYAVSLSDDVFVHPLTRVIAFQHEKHFFESDSTSCDGFKILTTIPPFLTLSSFFF